MAHMIMELDKVFTRTGDSRAWHGLDTQLDNLDTADASAVGCYSRPSLTRAPNGG